MFKFHSIANGEKWWVLIASKNIFLTFFQISHWLVFYIKQDIFDKLQYVLGEKFPGCLVEFLKASGFDSLFTCQHIDTNAISEIEKFVEANRDTFDNILSKSLYKFIQPFKFAPGHRILLNKIPGLISSIEKDKIELNITCGTSIYSTVLRALLEVADKNSPDHPKANRYNTIIQWFSVYIFLLCGRSCYETLSTNLPIPQASTICKLIYVFTISFFNRYSFLILFIPFFFSPVGYISQYKVKIALN